MLDPGPLPKKAGGKKEPRSKMARYRPPMDASRAMSALGFSPSENIDELPHDKIQIQFITRLQQAQLGSPEVDGDDPKKKASAAAAAARQVDIRIVHEAYQYVTKRKKKFSGRSMQQNWDVVGSKSKIMGALGQLSAQPKEDGEEDAGKKLSSSLAAFSNTSHPKKKGKKKKQK